MGFTRHVVEKALKEIGDDTIRPEIIVTWLLDHPEIAVSFSCSNPCLQLTFSMLINLFPTFLCVISSKWCRGFLIESFPQMCFEGKWLQNRLRAIKNESRSLLAVDIQGHQRGGFCIVPGAVVPWLDMRTHNAMAEVRIL